MTSTLLLIAPAVLGALAWARLPASSGARFWAMALASTAAATGAVVTSYLDDAPGNRATAWLVLMVLTSATLGGGLFVRAGLSLAERGGLHVGGAHLPGAYWIGTVERLTVTMALLLSAPEVAALVIAVKALAPYTEPTPSPGAGYNHSQASRILGTLLSLCWTLVVYSVFEVRTL